MPKVGRVVVGASCVFLLTMASAGVAGPVDLTQLGRPAGVVVHTQGVRVAAPLLALAPFGVLDNFNRADGPLGANWVVQAGSFGIVSLTARGSSGLATFVGGSGTALEADVATNGTANTDFVGLVLDYADEANNLFLKVQTQNAAGTFNTAGCYVGNNGTSGQFGLNFFNLSSTFATAHMRVERVGTTVTLTFTNIDGGSGTQTYVCTGAPATGGTGIGMGGFDGVASLDNFAGVAAAPPEPIPALGSLGLLLLALALVGSGAAWLLRRR